MLRQMTRARGRFSRPVLKPNWGWASLPALLIVWSLAASQVPSYVLPQPWEVVLEGWQWAVHDDLARQVLVSALREAGGFGAAIVFALAIGVASGLSPGFRDFSGPLVSLFMAIPPIAWAPLSLIFFGLGYFAIAVVIFIAAAFPMTVAIREGVLGIPQGLVQTARILGAGRAQLLLHVYLPLSLPFITAALRIGFAQAWRALIAAEMIGASAGIGWMVAMGGQIGNSSQVLLGIALIGLIAWLMEAFVFRRLERHYEDWRGQ